MNDVLNLLFCGAIFYSSFCRATKMDDATHIEIVLGSAMLGTAALSMAIAPWVWGAHTSTPQMLMSFSIMFVQATTGRLWSRGYPQAFQK